MITRKSLIIAVLCTFCLTVSIFSIMPVSSLGTYDSWLDYNDDGTIDLKDVYPMHQAFGAEGDPTKNVNVTNWPLDENGNLKVRLVTQPLQTFKDAVEIIVLDTTRTVNNTDYGISTFSGIFYFAFSPRQQFLNATGVAIKMNAFYETPGWHPYYLSLNGQTIIDDQVEQLGSYPMHYEYGRINSTSVPIRSGLNNIVVRTWPDVIFILKLTVGIEYQYKA